MGEKRCCLTAIFLIIGKRKMLSVIVTGMEDVMKKKRIRCMTGVLTAALLLGGCGGSGNG